MNLTAQWALFSKETGDMEDYRVLAASRGALAPSGYEQRIRRFLPGTPARDAGDRAGPDALPWVWLSPEREDASLGLAVLDKGQSKDFGGRRTDPTRYFRFGWSELASATPSYAGLAQALRPVYLRDRGGADLTITVASLDHHGLADVVDELSFERVATLAALLLERPVALLNPGPLSVDARLSCLDAIASLLPYGLRADLAASTWADSTARVRLNFGARARKGQSPVEWSASEAFDDLIKGSDASEYLRLLRWLHGRHGTRRIIEFLATETSRLTFDEPRQAVERLRALDPGHVVWSEWRIGRADPAAVRELLAADRVGGMDTRAMEALVGFLLSEGQATDLPAAERHWTPALLPVLCTIVADLLDQPDGATQARPYLEVAERQGGLDRLLTDMLIGQGAFERDSRPSATVQSQRLDLVRSCLRGPGRENLPELRATLLQEASAIYDLLARTRADALPGTASDIVGWLGSHGLSRELRPLAAVLDGVRVDDADLRALWQLGPQHVRTLLEVARHFPGTIAAILPVVWQELPRLVNAGQLPAKEQQAWLRTLAELAVTETDPMTAIRLDLMALALDGRDVQLLRFLQDDADGYLQRFHELYWASELEQVRPLLADQLIRHVERLPWTRPAPLANNVLSLLRSLVDPTPPPGSLAPSAKSLLLPTPLRDKLFALIGEGIRREPEVVQLGLYQDWWKPLLEQSPTHATKASVAVHYSKIQQGQPVEVVAEACARVLVAAASQQEDPIPAILSRLATPQYFATTEQFEIFLYILRIQLRRGGMVPEVVAFIDRRMISAALDGELGDWLSHAYPRHLGNLTAELNRIGDLVDGLRDLLTAEELDRLHVAARWLEQRLGRPSGRSGFKRWRPGRGGRP